MDVPIGDRNILEWDEGDVHAWLSTLGFSQYESQIRGPCSEHLDATFLTPTIQSTTYLEMYYVCLILTVSNQSGYRQLARGWLSSKPSTSSKLPTTFPSMQTIMCHHVSLLDGLRTCDPSHFAKQPKRQSVWKV